MRKAHLLVISATHLVAALFSDYLCYDCDTVSQLGQSPHTSHMCVILPLVQSVHTVHMYT